MTEVELLQSLLVAEHAAVYGYGVLGARLDDAQRELASAADDAHRVRRGQLADLLRARGAAAPATLPAYAIAVSDARGAGSLAVRIEEGLAARWRDLVGGTDDPALRRLGTEGLTETAVRAARWRLAAGALLPTVPLPGT